MRRRSPAWATALRRLVVLAAVAVAVLAMLPGTTRTGGLVPAANTADFDPGNIISDGIFFDGGAMTATQVQAFLDSKNPDCVPGSDGTVCLRVFRQTTQSRAADAQCSAYPGAAGERAADIIAKVGRACDINPRVLLVILQKEQGLVTGSGTRLYASRYTKAMGYGCSDTAACVAAYGGFFNQVYSAAHQYQKYRAGGYAFRAGYVNSIGYAPATASYDNVNDARCGRKSVLIQNQATAGLYDYTPYVPNAAALQAGYGTGDTCSAYGNRNFWLYYTDWFGSTHLPGAAEVADKYAALGGAGGRLGTATSAITCGLVGGGCFQDYVNGAIHWSPSSGVHATGGWIAGSWGADGRENGLLGYPTSDEQPAAGGGARQLFQGGVIYSSAAGAHRVHGWILDRWSALGAERSAVGYPTSEEIPAAGGVYQRFTGGVVYSSVGTGAHEVHGWVLDKWTALGREKGVLGFPTSDEVGTAAGAYNTFTGGAIYSTPGTGAREVHGKIGARWLALGAGKAAVGYPVSDQRKSADGAGAYNEFSNGVIYYSPATGAHAVTGSVAARWAGLGGIGSFLGYPTADARSVSGGSVTGFAGGSIYWSAAGGAQEVHGWIGGLYSALKAQAGVLGFPTSGEQRAPDRVGVFQTFTGGLIYSSPTTGAHEVHGAIEDKWTALGGLGSLLGSPVTDQLTLRDGRGTGEVFRGGAIFASSATGAHEVHGWIQQAYLGLGAEGGFLGYPTADETPVLGGKAALGQFQGGQIYSSPATGAREVHGAILARYLQLGGPTSRLGLPTKNEYSVKGARRSDFQHGWITCNTSTGAITVTIR